MSGWRVYLAGPIHGKTDEECRSWRVEAMRLLPDCECVDPTLWDYRGREHEHADEIVTLDKAAIRECGTLLVNATSPGWGTAMEVLYGCELGKQVIAFGATDPSPWLLHHCMAVVPTLAEACELVG